MNARHVASFLLHNLVIFNGFEGAAMRPSRQWQATLTVTETSQLNHREVRGWVGGRLNDGPEPREWPLRGLHEAGVAPIGGAAAGQGR